MNGLIHIYTGNGKGKTAAGAGLAIRFAGTGGKVLYTQFLKDNSDSELELFKTIPQITFLPSEKTFSYSEQLTTEQQNEIRKHYTAYFEKIMQEIIDGDYGLLVLDEIILADHLRFIPHEMLLYLLKARPEGLELVLTGQEAAEDLFAYADYISDFHCVKQPDWNELSAQLETRNDIDK